MLVWFICACQCNIDYVIHLIQSSAPLRTICWIFIKPLPMDVHMQMWTWISVCIYIFLPTYICVYILSVLCVLCLDAQSCPTLCTPWTVALQAPLSKGVLQTRILKWVVMSSSRGSSQPRDRTQVSLIVGGFFAIWATKEAWYFICCYCC